MALLRQTVVLVTLFAIASCSSPTSPAPDGFLSGTWETLGGSLETMTLTLNSSGGTVTGTVVDDWRPVPTPAQGTVTGTYGGGGFTLYLTFPAETQRWFGVHNRLTGQVLISSGGDNQLVGQWQETAPVDSALGAMTFFREPSEGT